MSIDITKKISKVTVNGQEMELVGIDVADTTAVANDVLAGKTFYGADGLKKTGTIEIYSGDTEISAGSTDKVLNTANKFIETNITVKAVEISAGTLIKTAELANVDFVLKDSSDQQIDTANTGANGKEIAFNVESIGTYKLYAYSSGTLLWSNENIVVNELNTIIKVPTTKSLNDYTWEQIHTACTNGYAHNMFEIGMIKKFEQVGSMFNNFDLFIEDIISENDKDYIDWRFVKNSSTKYYPNLYTHFLPNSTSETFSTQRSGWGGFKYSEIRKNFMKIGDTIYSHASGILPNDYNGSANGTKMQDLVYTDSGEVCKLFEYNRLTKNMEETFTPIPMYNYELKFIKGYFKSVGQIDEQTFNNGNYYTVTDKDTTKYGIFLRASNYVSGTTYYGLYETLQENGIFYTAISSVSQYLVNKKYNACICGYDIVEEYNDYCGINCVEELFGINYKTVLNYSSTYNLYFDNAQNEGSKLKIYDDFKMICGDYMTRSFSSRNSNSWNNIYELRCNRDYLNNRAVRIGFRTC